MMKLPRKYLPLLFILCLPLLAAECRDQQEQVTPVETLPAATKTGEETFGCLVNGEAWKTTSSYDLTATFQQGAFSLAAQATFKDRKENIGILISENGGLIEQGKSYSLTSPDNLLDFISLSTVNSNCTYRPEDTLEGSITFSRFDKEAQIASGTFTFKTAKEGCQTIIATDGRFDVKFTY